MDLSGVKNILVDAGYNVTGGDETDPTRLCLKGSVSEVLSLFEEGVDRKIETPTGGGCIMFNNDFIVSIVNGIENDLSIQSAHYVFYD